MNTIASLAHRAWLSLFLLLAGCALYASTLDTNYADLGGAFSPVFFPRIILMGWILLAILSLIADAMSTRSSVSGQWLVVAMVTLALFAYIELMPVIGFFLSSVAFSVVLLVSTGQKKWIDIGLFSIIVPGLLVALFNHMLTMPLPVSPLFWWA